MKVLRVSLLPAALIVTLLVALSGGSSIAGSPFVTPGATRVVLREYSMGDLERTLNIHKGKEVTKLASGLNELPLYPLHGAVNCPASAGHVYSLKFYYPAHKAETVQVEADGCRFVQRTGVDPRWTLSVKNQDLLDLLEQIVDSI